MSDSWEVFSQMVAEEARLLGDLHRVAIKLTRALIENNHVVIQETSKAIEVCRKNHQSCAGKRRTMQRRGFGKMTLREVYRFVPRNLATKFQVSLAQMVYYTTSLRITNENNKALVLSGMDRLLKIVDVLQNAHSEQSGTYRRRGIQRKKDASVMLSRQA